jgi:ABC-type branched-subunit amino acid transport system permease subunit
MLFQIDNLADGSTSLSQVVPDLIGTSFKKIAPSLRSKDRYVLQLGVNLVIFCSIILWICYNIIKSQAGRIYGFVPSPTKF